MNNIKRLPISPAPRAHHSFAGKSPADDASCVIWLCLVQVQESSLGAEQHPVKQYHLHTLINWQSVGCIATEVHIQNLHAHLQIPATAKV